MRDGAILPPRMAQNTPQPPASPAPPGARILRGDGGQHSPHSPTVDGARARLDGTEPAILAGSALPPRAPPSPWPAGSVVHLDVSGGRLRVDAPAGWRSPELLRRDLAPVKPDLLRARLRLTVARGRIVVADLDALAPELLRALAPELPPVDVWPASWCELFEERACIAAEASDVADPLAVAEADLRLAVWRGDVEALPVEAARAAG